MFGDWENYHEEDETLDALKRYQEMLFSRGHTYFDLHEYECIIDYYIEQINFKDALGAAKMAIKQHPYALSLKLKYIHLLIESGKPARALRVIKNMGNTGSSNYELFLAKGFALNLTGKHIEAKPEFTRALKLCNENRDEVAYSIAQSFIQIGQHTQAINYLLLAFRLNEDNILVLYDLALNYEKIGNPEKGIVYYHKYLDLDPFAEHIWNNLGLLYQRVNELDKASRAYDMALAINSTYQPAYFNKARMLMQHNKVEKAIQVYSELLSFDSANVKALCELGNCYEITENEKEALKSYRQALKLTKDCSDAWYGLGRIYYRQRKLRLSISSLNHALDIQPCNSDYWFVLGEALSAARNTNDAIFAFSRAANLNPLGLEAWMSCAQLLFRKKRFEEAIQLLNQIYQYNHDNSTVNYRLAAYYTYQGDIENAQKYFNKALSINSQECKEMFRHFPKTKSYLAIQQLVETTNS